MYYFFLYLILSMLYRLRLGLGKLRYHMGGPGGLPPGLGLGRLKYQTGVRGLAPLVRVRFQSSIY